MTPAGQHPHQRKRARIAGVASITLALGALACADGAATARGGDGTDGAPTEAVPAPTAVQSPAGPDSGEPNLVASPAGVYLSWLEGTDTASYALRFARWEGDAWGEPGQVMDRNDLFVNWADFPAFTALEDGTLAAHWLQKSGSSPYAYDVRVATSRDGGETWSEGSVPHRDGVSAEHGFVSLYPLGAEIGMSWLDGRETVGGEPMTLRFTTVSPDGELGPEALLDSSVCDCCQTGLATTSNGPIVVYRDRTAEEVRDIHVVRRVDGEWTAPMAVHEDGWVIPGCPVNGPSIDARDDDVAVVWFTGAPLDSTAGREEIRAAGSQGRVLAAFSQDAGATFSEPVRVDEGGAMGRVDLVLLDSGTAVVTWLERVNGAAEIRVRPVSADGAGPLTPVTGTAAERASGFPRMVHSGDRVFFAWTEGGEEPTVRTATARLPGGTEGGE